MKLTNYCCICYGLAHAYHDMGNHTDRITQGSPSCHCSDLNIHNSEKRRMFFAVLHIAEPPKT